MAFTNTFVEIQLGNVESCLRGPVPREKLDRTLNPHLFNLWHRDPWAETGGPAYVYRPARERFLTGALPRVKRLLKREGIRYRLRDFRTHRRRIAHWTLNGPPLRPYQEETIRRALETGHGLIDIGTGGGKTLLAAAIIARIGLPTLYLVTTRTLLEQTRVSLKSYLDLEPGVIGMGERIAAPLTVALIQSLDPGKVDLSPWQGGTLIFDEGHHAAASTYLETIRRIDPRYHYYLSAVPFRSGQDQVVLDAVAGVPLTDGQYSARFLIEKGYACPVDVRIETCRISGRMTEKTFQTLYKEFIVRNRDRNSRIADIAGEESAAGRSVLVLVDRLRHGRELVHLINRDRTGNGLDGAPEMSPGSGRDSGRSRETALFVNGTTPRRALQKATSRFSDGRLRCLVATSGLFQEGVSIDGIHVLIQAGGLRSRSKVLQAVGRGMRRAPGKAVCTYVDFLDDDEAGLLRVHSLERLRVLKEEGFHVPAVAAHLGNSAVANTDVLPLGSGQAAAEQIPATWTHVPGSKRFVRVDEDGSIVDRAFCIDRKLVPDRFCEKCQRRSVCGQQSCVRLQEISTNGRENRSHDRDRKGYRWPDESV